MRNLLKPRARKSNRILALWANPRLAVLLRGHKPFALLFGLICAAALLLAACANPSPTRIPTGLDLARSALAAFFDALHTGSYQKAAQVYGGSYSALQFLFPEVPPQDHAALFKTACESPAHVFSCWKLKDIVRQDQVSPGRYLFVVRFEDDRGGLLTGGDNKTPAPCLPPEECPRSQYTYTIAKVGDEFLVQELPVCAGCWP